MEIPPALDRLGSTGAGRAWLDRLPAIVETVAERWSLAPGPPFPSAHASLAMPVTLSDGSQAVLKLQYPDRESEHEAAALRSMAGEGAVHLLDHDPDHSALLIERCLPGTPLADSDPGAALDVFLELLPRTWKPGGPPFRPLSDEAAWWAGGLEEAWERAGRPFERRLLAAALEALRTLPASQGEGFMVNQDLQGTNVLRAAREPWLVIDPKPLWGEREFGIASVVRDGVDRSDVVRRLDRLTAELGLDRDRARQWTLAQTVAWAFEGDEILPGHLARAGWLLEAG